MRHRADNPGACFSKVPKLFGPISGTTIPLISSQRRGSKPSNFAILLVFLTFKPCSKISFSKLADCSSTIGFSGPKSPRDFRETGPRPVCFSSLSQIVTCRVIGYCFHHGIVEAMLIFKKFNSVLTKKLFYSRGKKAKLPFKNFLFTITFIFWQVDCDGRGKQLCNNLNVKFLPTIKVFSNGKSLGDYNGSRQPGIDRIAFYSCLLSCQSFE